MRTNHAVGSFISIQLGKAGFIYIERRGNIQRRFIFSGDASGLKHDVSSLSRAQQRLRLSEFIAWVAAAVAFSSLGLHNHPIKNVILEF